MQIALTVFWIVSGLGFAAGLVVTIVGLVRAPEGFEDETGFHAVKPASDRQTEASHAGHSVRPTHPELA